MASRIVYHKSLPHNKISSCGISSQKYSIFQAQGSPCLSVKINPNFEASIRKKSIAWLDPLRADAKIDVTLFLLP